MPSIFSRFADIINSNLNAMLDKAEDPGKMLKLIIGEMEDTLAEIKAACAQAMAEQARLARRSSETEGKKSLWLKRAELAAAKGRDDLAREALLEKRAADEALADLSAQAGEMDAVVGKYRDEIDQLEDKLRQARSKEEAMRLRKSRAEHSIKASRQMKQYDLTAAQLRLERLDSRLDRLEAEAELELGGRRREPKDEDRERAFRELDGDLDAELAALKERLHK